MPSPFPGMDPYLESPYLWPDLHTSLIVQIREQLVPQIRPKYAANVERRVYLIDETDPGERSFQPDVIVRETGSRGALESPSALAVQARIRPTSVQMARRRREVREARLVIRLARERELPVVTAIEVLSPANKTAGSQGREEYLRKRDEVMGSMTHLVEIDLLRKGLRVPSVGELPKGDYMAHVSRAAHRPMGEVYAWTLRDALPILPIPLRDDDPDVPLDLALALREVFERAAYGDQIDYARSADPPLEGDEVSWAGALLGKRVGGPET